ncbi:zinc finger BED domain-containing protein RICESLEEPER 3 [Tanacetum coccineum]
MEKILQIIQDLRFDISFTNALFFMPRFAPMIRNLLMNKEKLLELLDSIELRILFGDAPQKDSRKAWRSRQAKKTMFPVLSSMTMDILSVQDTSVASESAFSTSERVLSIRRTRLALVSLEMCMCLKDHLDAQERKQDKSTLETSVDFEEEILDADVQENEAIPLYDE